LTTSDTRRTLKGWFSLPFFKEFRVRRVLPLLMVVATAACSRSTPAAKAAASTSSPATTAGTTAPPAGQAATPATPQAETAKPVPSETAKPVPAQLPDVLARVNGEAITKKEFEDAVQSAEQQAGTQVPPDQRDRVYRQILDQLIGYKLLLQESKTQKVAVPDADIEARVLSLKQQFPTEDAFKQALAQRHMTLEQIKTDARQNMAISKLVDGAIASKVAVKPEDVQAFYQQNPQNFKESEKVHASHILISAPKTADAATRAKAKAKAESILKDVQSGKDFATLAKQNSEDPGSAANGGDLGFFQQGQMFRSSMASPSA